MISMQSRKVSEAAPAEGRRSLLRDCGGAVVVEFAFIGTAFIALMIATLHIMMVYLAQQMLETAAESAGRLLLTGFAQTATVDSSTAGMSGAEFKEAICNGASGTDSNGEDFDIPSLLPPLLDCSRLTVNVTRVASYNASSASKPTFVYDADGNIVSTGTGYNYSSGGTGQNQIVALQLIYLWPTGTGALGSSLIDQPNGNRMLVATSVFTTEDYNCASGQTTC